MSQWFKRHRQEYIAACLRTFGQVNRGWIMDKFGVSMPQASTDLSLFMAENPEVMVYDGSAKAYVVNKAGVPDPRVETADEVRIRQLEGALHDIKVLVVSHLSVGVSASRKITDTINRVMQEEV